jgi:nicotinamide riboside transporter PnuC
MCFFGLIMVLILSAADSSEGYNTVVLWVVALLPAIIGGLYFWELSDEEGYYNSRGAIKKMRKWVVIFFAGLVSFGAFAFIAT